MMNIHRLIKGYNSRILNIKERINEDKCNCRNAVNCLVDNVVYKATEKFDNHTEKLYIGLAEGTFKIGFKS